jgi:hypothetical protein
VPIEEEEEVSRTYYKQTDSVTYVEDVAKFVTVPLKTTFYTTACL